MPTEKQRRRRAKTRRHAWEYVYVDAEGREVEVEEADAAAGREEKRARERPATKQRGRSPRRAIEPPSWRRAIRRGALFAPLMLLTVFLLTPELSTAQKVTQTLLLVFIFVPFSYLLDTMMWRAYRKRLARAEAGKSAGRRGG